ncbi:MAG: hypothetical protein HKN86_06745 [Acidimicrobiia bacterium]|nr:hypothetical protein [Acidimicrobiia bacterium]
MYQHKLFFRICAFLIFLIGLQSFELNAQKVLKTESGQEIIILADGTWTYVKKATVDSLIQSDVDELSDVTEVESKNPNPLLLKELMRIEKQLQYTEAEIATQLTLLKDSENLLKEEIDLLKKGEMEDLTVDVVELEEELDIILQRQQILNMRYEITNTMLKECERLKLKAENLQLDELRSLQIQSNGVNAQAKQFGEEQHSSPDESDLETNPMLPFYFDIDPSVFDKKPNRPPCALRFEGIDEISKIYRKEVEIDHLFGYTHPKMRSYFKKGDFLTCKAFISKYGGYNLLNIEITIASPHAKKSYGSLERGAVMILSLLNGERIYAVNAAPDDGKIEPYTGNTIYRSRYTVQDSEIKELAKYELDKIGIIWSSGYEEYPVYNIDFFIHQIACLKSK